MFQIDISSPVSNGVLAAAPGVDISSPVSNGVLAAAPRGWYFEPCPNSAGTARRVECPSLAHIYAWAEGSHTLQLLRHLILYVPELKALIHCGCSDASYVPKLKALICAEAEGSWLGSPQPMEATKLSFFQPPEVHKEPWLGPNHQSHLYCCLDNTSPRPASTSTSTAASGCSMPRRQGRSGVTLLVSTKRTADLHSQVTLLLKMCSQVTVYFHYQVSHLSRHARKWPLSFTLKSVTSQDVLTSAPLTFTHKSLRCWNCPIRDRLATVAHLSFCVAVILLVWAWYCQLVPWVLCIERTLWAGFASYSICSDTVTCPFGQGHTQRFPILFVAQVPAQTSSSLQTRCHLNK